MSRKLFSKFFLSLVYTNIKHVKQYSMFIRFSNMDLNPSPKNFFQPYWHHKTQAKANLPTQKSVFFLRNKSCKLIVEILLKNLL